MRRFFGKTLGFCIFFSIFTASVNAFAIKDPFIEKTAESIKQVEIQYIYSDGKIITTTDSDTATVKVYGQQDALDALNLYQDGSKLKLKYNSNAKNNNNQKVYVEIAIPQQTDLEISVIDGEWSVDSLIGDIKLKSYGDGYFSFHELDSEEAELTLNGSGNIDIKGGVIEKFKAKILGSGAITFGGMADEAEFEIIGSGQLKIHQVIDKISNQTIFGSGKVKIKNPPSKIRTQHKKGKDIDLKESELNSSDVVKDK